MKFLQINLRNIRLILLNKLTQYHNLQIYDPVPPVGIEPTSRPQKSPVLSIELRGLTIFCIPFCRAAGIRTRNKSSFTPSDSFVGEPRIGLGPHAPKACILPLYYSPIYLTRQEGLVLAVTLRPDMWGGPTGSRLQVLPRRRSVNSQTAPRDVFY